MLTQKITSKIIVLTTFLTIGTGVACTDDDNADTDDVRRPGFEMETESGPEGDTAEVDGDTTGIPECPVGAETCPCTSGGACDIGLSCYSGLCVRADSEADTEPGVDTETDSGPEVETGADDDTDSDGAPDANTDADTVNTDTQVADTDTPWQGDTSGCQCMDELPGGGWSETQFEECTDAGGTVIINAYTDCPCCVWLPEDTEPCGNGVLDDDEECDDGNGADDDGCLSDCTVAFCGDGIVRAGVELCDDGNDVNNDGCTNECMTSVY